LSPTPLLLHTLKSRRRLAIWWTERKFCRKLDVPKENWNWGVGGEICPLHFEYWVGEP